MQGRIRASARRALALLAVVLAITFASYSQAKIEHPSRQNRQDDVVRVDTKLVTIPVNVVNKEGRFMFGLKKEQFRIFEDGVEQQVAYFENYEAPLVVCLMIDTSDSTKFKLAEIQQAAINFIKKLRADDRVLLVAFDREVRILSDLTTDRNRLVQAIGNIQSGGGTSVYNAVDTVMRQFLDRVAGRKAIVLFSDGVDTTSLGATYESTLNLAIESNAVIYVIKYDTYTFATEDARRRALSQEQMSFKIGGEPARLVYERASRYLMELADSTGGHLFEAGSSERLSSAFDQIIYKLREQYSIGYYPSDVDKPGRRRITVKTNIAQAKIRARRYYVLTSVEANSPNK